MTRKTIMLFILFILIILIIITYFDVASFFKKYNPYTNIKRLTYKPTVSVIVPSYNMARMLPKAIDSIINQTYKDWELIIIDDGSLDNTKGFLKPYYKNYKIRIFHNPQNIGLIKTLNKGIKLSRGEYLARLDADDYSLPDRLERQVKLMEKENLDLLSQTHFYEEKTINEKKDNFDTYSIGTRLLMSVYFSHSSVMLRKSFLDKHKLKYNITYPNAEDYDLWLAIFFAGGKIGSMGGQPISIYHPTVHRQEYYETQIQSSEAIRIFYLSKIIPNFDAAKILPLTLDELLPVVIKGNKTTKILDQKELERCYKTKCYKQQNIK